MHFAAKNILRSVNNTHKQMKNIITIMLLGAFTALQAQVIIGDASGTVSPGNKGSVLLEFASTNNKGIIVPYVRTRPAASVANQGTILLDASNAATARMFYSNGTNWIDLSGQDANVNSALTIQPTGVPESSAKSIIGANSSSADGVLVLESTTKAMVLPIVSDVNNILSPSPGMLVYVNKSAAKRLAVYNGSKWSFWKP